MTTTATTATTTAASSRKKSVADIFRDTTTANFAEEEPRYLSDLSPQQLAVLDKLRESVSKEPYPEMDGQTGSFRLDDRTLLRFLRAHSFNGYKATCAVKEHLKFRQQYVPHLITPRQVKAFVDLGFWQTMGLTRDGHPFELIVANKFNPQKLPGDELIRGLVYQREQVANLIREKQMSQEPAALDQTTDDFVLRDRTLLLIDAAEFNFVTQGSVNGMRQIKMIAELIQQHWPGTLGVAAVVNASVAFKWVFTLVRRLLDDETASRITFVSNMQELHELIDPSVLSKRYGGTLDDVVASPARVNASFRKTLVGKIKLPSSPPASSASSTTAMVTKE